MTAAQEEAGTKFRLRPVVVDERGTPSIVHYGPITPLRAQHIAGAKAEVDRMPPPSSGNCLQSLKEDGFVAAHRMVGGGRDQAWH